MSTLSALSPDSFSPLPELSRILARLRPPPSTATSAANPLNPLASPAPATSQPTPSVGASTPLPSAADGGLSATGPLSLKQIPAATDPIKHRLARARQQVKGLPDVERTVQQQEEEMEGLRARIREQKEVLRVLREVGERFGVQEVEAERGGEGKDRDGGAGEEMDVVMR